MINYLLFDLDNTLYPASSKMGSTLKNNINKFTAEYLNVSSEKTLKLRRDNLQQFGTTIKWLTKQFKFTDIEAYMKAVHPEDIGTHLSKEPEVIRMLEELPQKKSILTNSPIEHAVRVLDFLEIKDYFENIFDLRGMNFRGKPHHSSYTSVLDRIDIPVDEILFIDDVPIYLYPFKEMGGQILLIDEFNKNRDKELPSIRKITELPGYLK